MGFVLSVCYLQINYIVILVILLNGVLLHLKLILHLYFKFYLSKFLVHNITLKLVYKKITPSKKMTLKPTSIAFTKVFLKLLVNSRLYLCAVWLIKIKS